jgi:hypothetical protein
MGKVQQWDTICVRLAGGWGGGGVETKEDDSKIARATFNVIPQRAVTLPGWKTRLNKNNTVNTFE